MSWTDVTSYSRDERGTVEPRTWELLLNKGNARLCVTRHRDYPGSWVMVAYGCLSWTRELKSIELEAAKTEAISITRTALSRILSDLAI